MKLYAFGDSWTAGQGCNIKVESTIADIVERKKYRNTMSWPKYLSDFLNIEFENLSESASSNNKIFNKIIETIKSDLIKEGDLVVVMWSSSLRDDLPFFPKTEWHVWGKNYTKKEFQFNWIINSIKNNAIPDKYSNNPMYNLFLKEFKEFYIANLYRDEYYEIVNTNYILFIQKLLETYGIRYVMCDAFDKMISTKNIYINELNYYGLYAKTFKDYLLTLDSEGHSLWEDDISWNNTPGKHPNKSGYFEIAKELDLFIRNNGILKTKTKRKVNLL